MESILYYSYTLALSIRINNGAAGLLLQTAICQPCLRLSGIYILIRLHLVENINPAPLLSTMTTSLL